MDAIRKKMQSLKAEITELTDRQVSHVMTLITQGKIDY
jgi:hypothetical protein